MPYVEYDEVEAMCPDCGRLFRSEEMLDQHRDDVHRRVSGAPPVGALGAWKCHTCSRRFGSEVERNRHAREAHAR